MKLSVFRSESSVDADENQTTVITVLASDPDISGSAITYAKAGTDSAFFTLIGDVLTFTSAPDFETKSDGNADGTYEVEITATETTGGLANTQNYFSNSCRC